VEQSNLRRSRYVTGRQTQVNSTTGAKPTQETPVVAGRKTSSQDGTRQTQASTSTGIRHTGAQNSVRQTDPAVGTRHTGSQKSAKSANATTGKRQTQVPTNDYFDDDEYDDIYPTRTPSSARRYQGDVRLEVGRVAADVQSGRGDYVSSYAADRQRVPARRTATQSVPSVTSTQRRRTSDVSERVSNRSGEPTTQIGRRQGPRFHWLVYVGIVMVVMVVGWIGLTSFANWWQTFQDDLHYGRPRTVQVDAVVGHSDSPTNPSHFISTNVDGHIKVIEFQGGDDAKAKVYTGPVLIGQDLSVPLLTFQDVNGDKKPDMIVSIQQSRFVFINENGGFRALRPGEKIQMGN
jgi:hypothetical protein